MLLMEVTGQTLMVITFDALDRGLWSNGLRSVVALLVVKAVQMALCVSRRSSSLTRKGI